MLSYYVYSHVLDPELGVGSNTWLYGIHKLEVEVNAYCLGAYKVETGASEIEITLCCIAGAEPD